MQIFYLVWFLVAAVFSYFAYVHWRQWNSSIRPFTARGLEEGKAKGSDAATLIAEHVRDFNKYLETVNETNRSMNRNATIMYFVAVVVSVVALFLSFLA
jgi:hypothetical protein